MHPILFSYGDLLVPSWHFMFCVAAFVAYCLLLFLRKSFVPEIVLSDLAWFYLAAYFGGYFGARGFSLVVEEDL